jgi:DNA/RNA endonuclease YhcR with UshA esterase domain
MAGVLMAASPVFGHHSWVVDRTTVVTVSGTVTAFNWANPHVDISVDVEDENGNVEKWIVGGPSTVTMAIRGWDQDSLQPGDIITAVGFKAVDGSNLMRVQIIALADGEKLIVYGSC